MTATLAPPAQLDRPSAAQELIDDLEAGSDAPRLLLLFSVASPTGLAEMLYSQPSEDPGRLISEAVDEVMRTAGISCFDLGGNLFGFVAPGHSRPGNVVAMARGAVERVAEALGPDSLYGEVLLPDEADTVEGALALAVRRMRGRNSWREMASARQTRDTLLRAIEERGLASGVDRPLVSANAVAVGRRFGMRAEHLEVLVRAAELQDVGKLSIPDAILHKAGRLDAEEWAVVRRHPLVGERIINGAPALAPVARLVRSCYERWDGTGYPDGLAGEQIPLGARIVAVCVAFSAMMQARPWRPPMTLEEALGELRGEAGVQFDPEVVDALCLEVAPLEL